MKKIFSISILAIAFIIATSCDSGFADLNVNKSAATSVDPMYELNNGILNSAPPAGTLQYELAIVQQIITSNTGVNVGGNFNQVNATATPANWTNFYQNALKYACDVVDKTKADATRPNLYQMARIIRAYGFMVLTDTYGDIPYTEAESGTAKPVFFPKYDTQQAIYTAIISELTAAIAALDPAAKIETADALYAGDVSKWKKFGNSLLLRAGMRIMKADATSGKAAVQAAVAGGVILTNADNAVIKHDANYLNGPGNTLNGTEAANFYMTDIFVNALKGANDPRLPAIAIRFVGATSGSAQTTAVSTTAAANQYGMPMGSTDNSADAAGGTLPGAPAAPNQTNHYAFSQADRTRIASRTAPNYLVTAGMCNLLIAEAITNGTLTSGSALTSFNAGITAHMNQMASYGTASTILGTDITTYVASRAAAFGTNALKEINYEYWIASFMNGNEAWANYRRSGFPVLPPNPYSGVTVPFINRITYPPSENLVNTTNYNAASSSIGGDGLGTKVWWNK